MSSTGSDDRAAGAARGDGGEGSAVRWPGPDCPPAAALERLVLGTASAGEREALVDHLTGCEGCAALVRDLRSLEGWAERVGRVHRRQRPAAVRWVLPLAAMLVLAIGGAAVWKQLSDQRPGAATSGVRGAEPEVTPVSGSELARPPEVFSWPERPGATGYRVRLFDGRGEAIWESEWLTGTSSPAPGEVLRGAGGGQVFIWTVETRGAAAGPELGPFTFAIADPALTQTDR